KVRSFHFSAGHIFSADQPPFRFDATAGPTDAVNAVLNEVHERTSSPGSPVALFKGPRAKGLVIAPVVLDAREGYVLANALLKNLDGGAGILIGQSSAASTLQLPGGVELGPGNPGSAPILAHSSTTAMITFGSWTGVACQDKAVRFPGAHDDMTLGLGVP